MFACIEFVLYGSNDLAPVLHRFHAGFADLTLCPTLFTLNLKPLVCAFDYFVEGLN